MLTDSQREALHFEASGTQTDAAPAAVAQPATAELISDRAMALAKSAESLARILDERLTALGPRRHPATTATPVLAALTALGGLVAALLDVLARFELPLIMVTAALAVATFASGVVARFKSERWETTDLPAHIATCRRLAQTARRIDSVLASLNWRGSAPAAGDLRLAAGLLDLAEQDLAALWKKKTAQRDGGGGTRRHERVVPRDTRTTVRVKDGRVFTARIIDISLSGVAIETELPSIQIGDEVVVGSREAKAVRKLQRGLGFEFARPIDAADFDVSIRI